MKEEKEEGGDVMMNWALVVVAVAVADVATPVASRVSPTQATAGSPSLLQVRPRIVSGGSPLLSISEQSTQVHTVQYVFTGNKSPTFREMTR